MRRILSLLFILSSFAGTSQQLQYLGAPNTTVLSRGPFGFALRDTTFTPAQRGVVVHRPADNALYVSVSNTSRPYWMKLGSGAGFVAEPQQCGEMQGGLVTHDSLLVYSVSPAAFYYINCRRYSSNGGRVTLAAAHATLPRRDKIAFDTLGNVVVFTGVPAADPVAIALDPAVYRDLAEVLVTAATTTDANAINELVFDENIGQPQEFNFSLSGDVSASGNNTATNASKTKSIIVNSWGTGSSLVFTAAAEFSVVDLSTFTFFIRLPVALTDAQNISVRFRRGGSVASSAVVMPVNKTLLNQWQAVTVRLSDFTFFDMTIDVVDILFGGSNSNTVYFDYIRFQKGVQQVTTPAPSGNYVSHIYKSGDSVFYNIGGTSHFAYLSGAPLDTLPFSLTTTGTSGPATFDTATGILNIPQYSGGGGGGTTLSFPYTAQKYLTGYNTFGNFQDSARAAINLTSTGTGGEAATYNSTTGTVNVPKGPWFNIKDFGATTGSADNATAIQAAINAALAAGGGTVYVPQGTWNTGKLISYIKVRILGEGYMNSKLYSTQDTLISIRNNGAPYGYESYTLLDNIYLDGHGVAKVGLYADYAVNFIVNKTYFATFTEQGVYLKNSLIGSFQDCAMNYNKWGIYAKDGTNNLVHINNCVLIENTKWAIEWQNGGMLTVSQSDIEKNGILNDTTSGGIYYHDNPWPKGLTVYMTWFEENYGQEIWIGTNTTSSGLGYPPQVAHEIIAANMQGHHLKSINRNIYISGANQKLNIYSGDIFAAANDDNIVLDGSNNTVTYLGTVFGSPSTNVIRGTGNTITNAISSGTSSQWTTTGSDIYYNTGRVAIGKSTVSYPLDLEYNLNNYKTGINIKNTNTTNSALSGVTIDNAAGTRVGQMLFVPSNYITTSLQNTMLFSSVDNVKLGFVSDAVGTYKPDIYFKSGNNTNNAIHVIGSTNDVLINTSTDNSTLTVNGSLSMPVTYRTNGYTVTKSDYTIKADATTVAFTVTLPTAVGIAGRIYVIKKTDATANAVTVATTSSQTIDGSTTYTLATSNKYVIVQSDNNNWMVIGNN